jgi:hypothetical protein
MSDTWILYQTTNLINGKIYVGVHKLADTAKSKRYLGSGDGLRAAINKYGRKNFIRVTLAEFSCADDAYASEEAVVNEEFINRPDTYNMKIGGLGHKGIVAAAETRAKLSKALKGKTHTLMTKMKISNSHKGKVFSEEHRANLSTSHKGYTHTAETKAKMSAILKGNKRSVGRIVSDETRAKISIASKGRNLGKTLSEKQKNKIRESQPCSIPVIVHGKYYTSIGQAAEFEKVSSETMTYRLKSTTFKMSSYRFATEEDTANFLKGGVEGG